MKKLLFALLLLMPLCVSAQHLKFMNIPIDGKINSFASKLNAKGFTLSPKNKQAGVGLRIMKGRFFDQPAELWISYTPQTSIVYSVRVVFWSNERTLCESFMKDIKNSISYKYNYEEEEGKTKGGSDITIYHIMENEEYTGDIYIGISQSSEYYGYDLNLTYEDFINSFKNEYRKSDDI